MNIGLICDQWYHEREWCHNVESSMQSW